MMYVILETDSANYLKLNIAKITYCRSASENYCNYRYTYQKPNKINSLKKNDDISTSRSDKLPETIS